MFSKTKVKKFNVKNYYYHYHNNNNNNNKQQTTTTTTTTTKSVFIQLTVLYWNSVLLHTAS